MILVTIDSNNIRSAIAIQRELFPDYDATVNYVEAVEGISGNEYWILSVEGALVGISGIYSLKEDPDSAWLGWFGILPRYRRKKFGSEALSLLKKKKKKRGFRYARLYTGRWNNDVAKRFYVNNGYVEEYYDCPEDSGAAMEALSVFSKKLFLEDELPFWNNKNMHIDEQLLKEQVKNRVRFLTLRQRIESANHSNSE